jgi:hypothetical protein
MSVTMRTNSSTRVIRQIESADGLKVFSTVQSIGGFRFVEETNIHEPAGAGYDDYWYWERTHESGMYATEQEAFDDGLKAVPWLQNSK